MLVLGVITDHLCPVGYRCARASECRYIYSSHLFSPFNLVQQTIDRFDEESNGDYQVGLVGQLIPDSEKLDGGWIVRWRATACLLMLITSAAPPFYSVQPTAANDDEIFVLPCQVFYR